MASYQQFAPIEAFRSLVDAYWINRADAAPSSAPFDRILPDGCIDLIFRGGGASGGALFSSALIDRPFFVTDARPGWFVGARFKPAMARAVIDMAPTTCRDRNIPAADIDPAFAALEDRLRHCRTPDRALAVLRRGVDQRLATHDRGDAPARVCAAISMLSYSTVRDVASSLGVAERSLQRDLVQWSGLAPKTMARILRMQRTMAAIRAGGHTGGSSLSTIAYRMGYADQAHMTRELKALAGYTLAELTPRRHVRFVQDAADAAAYLS